MVLIRIGVVARAAFAGILHLKQFAFAGILHLKQFAQRHQFAQRVIDCRPRDIGHDGQDMLVDVFGGGMTVVSDEDFEDSTPLWGDLVSVLAKQRDEHFNGLHAAPYL